MFGGVAGRVVLVSVLLALLVSAQGSAQGTRPSGVRAFPSRNGEIVFSRQVHDGAHLYVMRPDGTYQRRITGKPGDRATPTWSPSGELIAYTKDSQGRCPQIYLLRPVGGSVRRLTAGCYHEPAWSPDGRKIVFSKCGGDCQSQSGIWTLNVNGSGLHRLSAGTLDADPSWSPDGATIAFVRAAPWPPAIWLMDADGTNQRQLTTPPNAASQGQDGEPDWSPDGKWIAFAREHEPHPGPRTLEFRRDIYLVRPDGADLRRLTQLAGQNRAPAWSPDGKRIVFTSDRVRQAIYVMNADGSKQRRLTTGPDDVSPDWGPRL
jgi:TolB protein